MTCSHQVRGIFMFLEHLAKLKVTDSSTSSC